MALKRLSNDVQSLLSASAQVNSYKRAIEELIYNSLDAKSTSIAIRIHIQASTVQVIDNGNGIAKQEFNAIGQRYMTSKLTDLATLKAAPNNYGYRGEFIANIIKVSQMVKITSRHEGTEETWAKSFIDGKAKKFSQMTTRPTKGTTIDIKGFLYNLNIQKRTIDSTNELQNIKSFLEQLSLVHSHISISLRDDAQNEIVFKIHKKRDIFQTLSTLFNIDKSNMQELQVEKHDYKVTGYIGKTNQELDLHWIFLNGKFIHNRSKLHKVLNEYFKISLQINDHRPIKSKKINDENRLFNQSIPFYFIFVSCPYIDYDISYTPKQSVMEFKNWEPIKKLLQKFVKFYAGDGDLKEIKKVENRLINEDQINTKINQDTRDQVKKIMDKILGIHSKKLGVSQLQNGIKGKMVKRKVEKKKHRSAVISKLFLQNVNQNKNDDNASIKSKAEITKQSEHNIKQQIVQPRVDDLDKKKENIMLFNPRHRKKKKKIPAPMKYETKETPIPKKNRELKANIVSPAKNRYKAMKQKHISNKHCQVKDNKKEIKYLKDLDSVYKRSKIVAQKAEHFLQNQTKRRYNINPLKSANWKGTENNMIFKNKYCAISDNIETKTKKNIIEKYIMNKLKAKSYKTTYDLVETVLKSQQELINAADSHISEELDRKFYKLNDTLHCATIVPKQYACTNKYICSEYSTNDGKKENISQYTTDHIQFKISSVYEDNFSEYRSICRSKEISDFVTNVSKRLELKDKEENMYSQNLNIYCTQKESSYRTLSDEPRILTYDSHEYHKHEAFTRNDTDNLYTFNKRQNLRCITTESRNNFSTSNYLKNKFKMPYGTVSNKQTKTFDMRMKQTIDESYKIKYSKSYENNTALNYNNSQPHSKIRLNFIEDNDYFKQTNVNYEPLSPGNDLNTVFENTYIIHPSNSSLNFNINVPTNAQSQNIQATRLFETYSVHDSHSEVNRNNDGFKTNKDDLAYNNKNFNIVFVSKSQQHSETVPSDNMIVEPLNVCETVFYDIGSDEREFAFSFNENNQLNDSLYGNIKNSVDECIKNGHGIINQGTGDTTENVSHHFSCAVKTVQPNILDKIIDDTLRDPMEMNQDEIAYMGPGDQSGLGLGTEHNFNTKNMDCNFEINFNLKNRPRFVPKGMSQIFENCRTKIACDYELDKDYYEDSIYNNFANDVQFNSEIYEPIIQNVDDLTTKNIHKFQNKVKKDNASLVFDETSLKDAKVLGQADCKLIVAIMKKRCEQTKERSEYLILFDQHAVHERIRLEKNLSDYWNEERWTSVSVDNIILKMDKDEILYLHNYKDKFTQLGLQWTILNDNEVTVHSIPEAILGKNPREVKKVIIAVRHLIVEEINTIKLQKGCVSLYPKSIMDLVFSESCRYAIKFGDQLSKSDCVKLIKVLSNCKTPFQCAHGRPVMAVIMDIITDKREYKINMDALLRFRQRSTRKH